MLQITRLKRHVSPLVVKVLQTRGIKHAVRFLRRAKRQQNEGIPAVNRKELLGVVEVIRRSHSSVKNGLGKRFRRVVRNHAGRHHQTNGTVFLHQRRRQFRKIRVEIRVARPRHREPPVTAGLIRKMAKVGSGRCGLAGVLVMFKQGLFRRTLLFGRCQAQKIRRHSPVTQRLDHLGPFGGSLRIRNRGIPVGKPLLVFHLGLFPRRIP